MAEKGNTKQEILAAALDLFSAQAGIRGDFHVADWWLEARHEFPGDWREDRNIQPAVTRLQNSSRDSEQGRIHSRISRKYEFFLMDS